MRLKRYQQSTLDVLTCFFKDARLKSDPAVAFNKIIEGEEQAIRLKGYAKPYKAVKGLERVPYVCLRLPTGGGKTLLAAHAIIQARDHWLERDHPAVLWLVPSDAIRRQTVEALKDPRHFYRSVLDEAFESRVRVFDISDFTQVTPSDLASKLCIFVGTVQTLKVSNTDGRKVYANHEMLEPHFAKISPATPGLDRNDDGPFKGDVRFSFANLMHVHNPLVIVDEAHNVVSSLADEMQRRINPSAIIQFTATPRNKSNILHTVTAQELKDEQMIKMPVVLEEHETWQSAVNGAILRQAQLEQEAKRDRKNYIRPIVLFQAQNKDQPINVDALRDHLVDAKSIPPEKIAVVTGKQRELDGIDLKDPNCEINYVITVQALKEGWDCSFAYVFCSVANISKTGDAEQLLGRVLRMPYATKRTSNMLNKSYACLSSPKFQDTVKGLVDKLIDMGFDESEVAENIENAQPELLDGFFGRKSRPTPTFGVSIDAPVEDIKGIERAAPLKIIVGPDALGKAKVTVRDFLTPEQEKAVFEKMPEKHHGAFQKELAKFKAENHDKASPAQRGEEFIVPRLMTRLQGEFVFADNDLLMEYHDWTLNDHAHQLTEKQFSIRQVANTFEVDLDEGSLQVQLKDQTDQLSLYIGVDGWTEHALVLWLDRKVRDRYIGQSELISWLSAVVAHLIHDRGIILSTLMRCQYVLARRLQDRLAEIYTIERNKIYQGSLFDTSAAPSLSFENGFKFFDGMFDGVRTYQGRTVFGKHFTGKNQVPAFDGLGEDGEEFQCAMFLDANTKIKHWIRNVARHPNAFWLPLAHGKFYPDFVAELENGQLLVVEYKGDHLRSLQDTKEKIAIGRLWEKVSNGKGLFLLALKEDDGLNMRDQLAEKLA